MHRSDDIEKTHYVLPKYEKAQKLLMRDGSKFYRAIATRHNRTPHRRVFIGPRFKRASEANEYGKKWEKLAHDMIQEKFIKDEPK